MLGVNAHIPEIPLDSDLCFFLIVHVQNESAEAAAIQVGATGHKAPGHTGYLSVQWAQEVLWAADYHPKE